VADIAPHKPRMEAILTTVVVVAKMLKMYPIHTDRMNWARNTMLLKIATSVPSPRSCVPCVTPPSLVSSNYKEAGKAQYINKYYRT
jgi:hypothetical protein